MSSSSASGNVLTIDGNRYALAHPIEKVVDLGDVVAVLYDPDSVQLKWAQFPNLVGITRGGVPRWTAELPTTETGDSYYTLSFENGLLRANSVKSFRVLIDPETGKIVDREFTK